MASHVEKGIPLRGDLDHLDLFIGCSKNRSSSPDQNSSTPLDSRLHHTHAASVCQEVEVISTLQHCNLQEVEGSQATVSGSNVTLRMS